jgi:hypothetical protein
VVVFTNFYAYENCYHGVNQVYWSKLLFPSQAWPFTTTKMVIPNDTFTIEISPDAYHRQL